MKSRGNELEVSGGMVREEQQRQGCPRVHRTWERKKKRNGEQGNGEGEKRREEIGSGGWGGKESRARVTMSLIVRCQW
jgi:hypothetical protein